jgi:hypothetical protein
MALPAGDFSIGGFWSGFYFNNLIECFAVRAKKQRPTVDISAPLPAV